MAALWSADRGGAHDVARPSTTGCGVPWFDQEFLQKFELKRTKQ
jgi:hypothetical protein